MDETDLTIHDRTVVPACRPGTLYKIFQSVIVMFVLTGLQIYWAENTHKSTYQLISHHRKMRKTSLLQHKIMNYNDEHIEQQDVNPTTSCGGGGEGSCQYIIRTWAAQ
jgi:hypothetical protein